MENENSFQLRYPKQFWKTIFVDPAQVREKNTHENSFSILLHGGSSLCKLHDKPQTPNKYQLRLQ